MTIRPAVAFAKDYFKNRDNLIIAEIGVQSGAHAQILFDQLSPVYMALIDPWVPIDRREVGEDYRQADKYYRDAKNRFQENDRVRMIKGYSQEELPRFPVDYFDFIYIDGDHFHEAVVADIRNSIRATRIGGIVGGHDWGHDTHVLEPLVPDQKLVNVSTALREVFAGKEVNGNTGDWWIIVDEEKKKMISTKEV